MTFDELEERAERAKWYRELRELHPTTPACRLFAFMLDTDGALFEQFECERYIGHRWIHTGTAYGGEDESYHGEGRVYCSRCGADGDA